MSVLDTILPQTSAQRKWNCLLLDKKTEDETTPETPQK